MILRDSAPTIHPLLGEQVGVKLLRQSGDACENNILTVVHDLCTSEVLPVKAAYSYDFGLTLVPGYYPAAMRKHGHEKPRGAPLLRLVFSIRAFWVLGCLPHTEAISSCYNEHSSNNRLKGGGLFRK